MRTATVIPLIILVALLAAGATAAFTYSSRPSADATTTATVTTTAAMSETAAAMTTTVTQTGSVQVSSAGGSGNSSGALSLNPEQVYNTTDRSIVTVQGTQETSGVGGTELELVLGSGFIINYNNSFYVVTNYHVVDGDSNLTVTFSNGDAYPATTIGYDPYSDMAIVTVQGAPSSEFYPLTLTSSSLIHVGQPVVAIGNPFGLAGSITYGIVSQLGRTIQDPVSGNFSVADAIQFSAPINPGNSGGPLITANDDVVGMTTATVSGSEGVGFAIPSDTIISEIPSLIKNGTFTGHSYLGIDGADMNYQLAQAEKTNVTYGVLIETVVSGSPAATAGLRGGGTTQSVVAGQTYLIGGDVIVSANGTRILDNDALAAYLQENTHPGQSVLLGIIRGGQNTTLSVVLTQRPPLPSS